MRSVRDRCGSSSAVVLRGIPDGHLCPPRAERSRDCAARMSRNHDVWTLFAGNDVVADLGVTGGSFPWLEARVEARPAFDGIRPLFDAEWAASQVEDWDRADELYRQINAALRLADPDGVEVAEFLLHIQGDDAWWRWSYEPLEE